MSLLEKLLHVIHRSLKLDFGSFAEEYPEQVMAALCIPPHARVLELGGNIGRNSCVIGALLADSANLVVMESDPDNARRLLHNRDLNAQAFHVEAAALSKRPLRQKDWASQPDDGTPLEPGWKHVRTVAWDDLVAKYGTFDTLVADCEGALYYILQDEPDFLRHFKLVVIENDFTELAHKQFCDAEFTRFGLQRIICEPGGPGVGGPCAGCFYEAWQLP